MLYEISCDKFKNKNIIFCQTLNTVLGDDIGSNSIGKSTFLMIIDFVFGGKDYILLSKDIQKNIGEHVIKMHFIFDGGDFFFCRNTNDLEVVGVCDSEYHIQSTIPLSEYCALLKEKYGIKEDDISFRDMVGRFSRVYGKENLNEKRPLDVANNEKAEATINALLKILGLFSSVVELEKLVKEKEDAYKAYKKAQKFNYISSINRATYKKNIKVIAKLEEEKGNISKELEGGLSDIDSLITDEILSLKHRLSKAKRQKSKYSSQITMIEDNIDGNKDKIYKNYEGLLEYFPQVNIKKIEEVDIFHNEIINVLKQELADKKKELENVISITDDEIKSIEESLNGKIKISTVSDAVLIHYSEVQRRIDKLISENNAVDTIKNLETSKKDTIKRRDLLKTEQLLVLQNSINNKMQEINDYIYSGEKKPPMLTFDKKQYLFQTIDDNGTGTNYKSMIVYDLCIMELSDIPFLIHDSVLLKQISDVALEKILQRYISENRQIFISIDKKTAYSKASQDILIKHKVLELSPNGNELFGVSWNNKE